MLDDRLVAAQAVAPAEAGLQLTGLSKGFASVQALTDVSLAARPGEIVALVGENGAGKSTLLRILSGDYLPDGGSIRLDGRPVAFDSPLAARRSGIRVIYQEPEIIPGVDVAENIWVGELPRRGPFVWRRRLRELVRADLERHGFEDVLPVHLMGDRLSAAQRQLVEIMRALKSDVRVLALDEPTSSLTDTEVERLFALVRRLRSQGVAIIYVSHRIKEILQLADRVTVLRDGRLVAARDVGELSEDEIVRLMVGRQLEDVFHRRRATRSSVVLGVQDLKQPVASGSHLRRACRRSRRTCRSGRRRPHRVGKGPLWRSAADVWSSAGRWAGGLHTPANRRHPARSRIRP